MVLGKSSVGAYVDFLFGFFLEVFEGFVGLARLVLLLLVLGFCFELNLDLDLSLFFSVNPV